MAILVISAGDSEWIEYRWVFGWDLGAQTLMEDLEQLYILVFGYSCNLSWAPNSKKECVFYLDDSEVYFFVI